MIYVEKESVTRNSRDLSQIATVTIYQGEDQFWNLFWGPNIYQILDIAISFRVNLRLLWETKSFYREMKHGLEARRYGVDLEENLLQTPV